MGFSEYTSGFQTVSEAYCTLVKAVVVGMIRSHMS